MYFALFLFKIIEKIAQNQIEMINFCDFSLAQDFLCDKNKLLNGIRQFKSIISYFKNKIVIYRLNFFQIYWSFELCVIKNAPKLLNLINLLRFQGIW